EEEEKICRICHLNSDQAEFATSLIQLGCGCKGELGIAHVHCGEAWFKLKGNRTCEICGEAATNITGVGDVSFIEEWNESGATETVPEISRARGCWRGQPFCNFLMACLVIAFVLPWFFRINMF
uniref:RING-CH-type domain-containing protein n=1 Tax=Kalanchoe fedtschenkoi TaxID=63787 RepID=A0A7N0T427_KALFE